MDRNTVERLWLRPAPGAAPVEVDALELTTGEGIVGDHTRGGMRHITLLWLDDWNAAASEVGVEVDPVGRRANVLLSGGTAARFLDRELMLGTARLRVRGVTAPCPVMDLAAPGMMRALKPEARSGVWARVLEGGMIRRGDILF